MQDHRKLRAFELADQLVIEVYRATRCFPREEMYGLTSQMRRAAVSVAANIVEGCARESLKEYANFLNLAFGSLRELGYYLGLSVKLGFIIDLCVNNAMVNAKKMAVRIGGNTIGV